MTIMNQYYPESVTPPADFLLEILEENQMGAKEVAIKTGKPEKTISAVIKGKSAITPDMALLFEQVLKTPAHFWLEAQKNFDEYQARINYQKSIEEAKPWALTFPYPKMANLGWVEKTRSAEEKVIELLKYFGVASQKGYEDYYYNQRTKVAFRISLKNHKNASAIASWLRQGELQAGQLSASNYNKVKLNNILPQIKKLMAIQPANFFIQLQNICLQAGVKVVYTPCLPNTAIHGATRWIKDNPLIQLTGRYKRNDIFWFTFFHEIAHILLHGKKYISIENIKIEGEKQDYEREADKFAAEYILSEKEEKEICKLKTITHENIVFFAKKFGIHPANIIGRLQHKKIIDYSQGKEFFSPINFIAKT